MEKINLYSVFDSVVEEYCAPFVAKNDNVAIRIFTAFVKGSSDHATDLSLYSLGSFDKSTGDIFPSVPGSIFEGIDALDVLRCTEEAK